MYLHRRVSTVNSPSPAYKTLRKDRGNVQHARETLCCRYHGKCSLSNVSQKATSPLYTSLCVDVEAARTVKTLTLPITWTTLPIQPVVRSKAAALVPWPTQWKSHSYSLKLCGIQLNSTTSLSGQQTAHSLSSGAMEIRELHNFAPVARTANEITPGLDLEHMVTICLDGRVTRCKPLWTPIATSHATLWHRKTFPRLISAISPWLWLRILMVVSHSICHPQRLTTLTSLGLDELPGDMPVTGPNPTTSIAASTAGPAATLKASPGH